MLLTHDQIHDSDLVEYDATKCCFISFTAGKILSYWKPKKDESKQTKTNKSAFKAPSGLYR